MKRNGSILILSAEVRKLPAYEETLSFIQTGNQLFLFVHGSAVPQNFFQIRKRRFRFEQAPPALFFYPGALHFRTLMAWYTHNAVIPERLIVPANSGAIQKKRVFDNL